MDHPTLILIFTIVVTVAIVLQTLILLALYLMARSIGAQVGLAVSEVRRHADVIRGVFSDVSEIISSSKGPVKIAVANLAEVSRLLHERVASFDAAVGSFLDRTRAQGERVDLIFSNAAGILESIIGAAQRTVQAPVREMSALVRGIRSGIEFFLSRRQPAARVHEAAPDEEMFI